MNVTIHAERLSICEGFHADHSQAFAHDVQRGLTGSPKSLPPKYFYDDHGSELYQQICELAEYYPYRAERQILMTHAEEIHAEIASLPLVEFGSGNATKTRYLLAQYERVGKPFLYCPVDIARSVLLESAVSLLTEFSHLSVRALHTDFACQPKTIESLQLEKKAVAFFGSSLGNFTPEESVKFMQQTATILEPEDVFILGIDLKKSTDILIPAYDDPHGVTASFNLNLLHRINRELGGTFDPEGFEHLALYNEDHGRIEMHLRSLQEQLVTIERTGQTVRFAVGETIHTENSYKYSVEEINDMGKRANLALHRTWFDNQNYFLVALFRPDS